MNDILQDLNDAKAQDIGYETKARITTVICRMLADSKRPPTQNVAVELASALNSLTVNSVSADLAAPVRSSSLSE